MPKLLILAPCDNVLINKDDAESVSLIVILTQFVFPPLPSEMPDGVVVPIRWFIFTQWEVSADDVGLTFEQQIKLVGNSQEYLTSEREFTGAAGKIHFRLVAGVAGLPVVPSGQYQIIASLRKKGEADWVEAGSYPIQVVLKEQTGDLVSNKDADVL